MSYLPHIPARYMGVEGEEGSKGVQGRGGYEGWKVGWGWVDMRGGDRIQVGQVKE